MSTRIIGGNYADPTVIRVGDDFYMTHSSYKLTPGLIIWHSRDLLNWTPVSAALQDCIGDVWAPDFAEYAGTYYIYFPAGGTNWVVTAPHPTGPWSKPVDLGIRGIDPGHTVGPDGRRYLHLSGGEMVRLAEDGLSVIGEPRRVYDGWKYPEDWVVEGYSLEGPKLTRRNGWYYLIVAVGGTAGPPTSHMAVAARSRTPWGPWEHSPYNPIVHTYSAEERWWSKGHASLIDGPDGRWWIVYHAYINGFHTLGRQTLIDPVEWTEDGWFRVATGPLICELPARPVTDTFGDGALGLHWQCEGKRREERFRCVGGSGGQSAAGTAAGERGGSQAGEAKGGSETAEGMLVAEGAPADAPPAPLLFMPADKRYEIEVTVGAEGDAEGRVLLYYNESNWFGMGVSAHGVRFLRSFKTYGRMPGGEGPATIRIRNDRHIVSFYYRYGDGPWTFYDKRVDASGFHHNTFGGFLSLRVGLDAVGDGRATFRRFRYTPLADESGDEA